MVTLLGKKNESCSVFNIYALWKELLSVHWLKIQFILTTNVLLPNNKWILVAQLIEHPPCAREVMGSIPVGDSDFFFVPRSCHVDQFTFDIIMYIIVLSSSS